MMDVQHLARGVAAIAAVSLVTVLAPPLGTGQAEAPAEQELGPRVESEELREFAYVYHELQRFDERLAEALASVQDPGVQRQLHLNARQARARALAAHGLTADRYGQIGARIDTDERLRSAFERLQQRIRVNGLPEHRH